MSGDHAPAPRPTVPPKAHAIAALALLITVPWALALVHVARNDWFGVNDLRPFAFWCVLSAALGYPALRAFQRLVPRVPTVIDLAAAVVCGLAIGYVWMRVVWLCLGPWINAFSFPVFLCWASGAMAAFLAIVAFHRPRAWAAVLALAIAAPFGLRTGLTAYYEPPPDAVIYFKPGTPRARVTEIWTHVLSQPLDVGSWPLEGIRILAASDDGTRYGIRVSFRPRTTDERRAEILARVRALDELDEIVDVPPTAAGKVKGSARFEPQASPAPSPSSPP